LPQEGRGQVKENDQISAALVSNVFIQLPNTVLHAEELSYSWILAREMKPIPHIAPLE
jgi:hypothetical protein